jgi:hypothetical protein
MRLVKLRVAQLEVMSLQRKVTDRGLREVKPQMEELETVKVV